MSRKHQVSKQIQTNIHYSHHDANFLFSIVFFVVLNDHHLSQVLSNILQVKDRGATTIVLTALQDIKEHIEMKKIDFLIQLDPNDSILAALQAVTPL